jgi:hypothetical protein
MADLSAGARSAITLVVLLALLVAGAAWGFKKAFAPFPGKVDSPLCVPKSIAKGTRVFPADVTVSVYNAGTRDGLAGRVMQELTDAGFRQGADGNAPRGAKVATAQVWATDPKNPAVLLVAGRLGPHARVVKKAGPGPGVDVVVGDRFTKVVKGKRAIVASHDSTICSPPVE